MIHNITRNDEKIHIVRFRLIPGCYMLGLALTAFLGIGACQAWTSSAASSCSSSARMRGSGESRTASISTEWTRARATGKSVLYVSSDDDLEEDQEVIVPINLRQSLNDLFQLQRKAPVNEDPSGGFALNDIQDYFDQRQPGDASPAAESTASLKSAIDLDESYAAEDTPEDGLYLDPDLYVKSKEWLNPDGSLNLPADDARLRAQSGQSASDYKQAVRSILLPPPTSPDAVASGSGARSVQSMEDLWATLQQKQGQAATPNITAAEDLHQQVFAEEQGFLQQSQIFRESLTDSKRQDEAKALRHGEKFRLRQSKAIASLDQQIEEWEQGWEANYAQAPHCSKCHCILSTKELPQAAKHDGLCQVCYGEVLVANSNFNLLRDTDDDPPAAPKFRGRPSSRTALTRSRAAPTTPNPRRELGAAPQSTSRTRAPQSNSPTNPANIAPSTGRIQPPAVLSSDTPPPQTPSKSFRPRVRRDGIDDDAVGTNRPGRSPPPRSGRPTADVTTGDQRTTRQAPPPSNPETSASKMGTTSRSTVGPAETTRPPRNWPQRPVQAAPPSDVSREPREPNAPVVPSRPTSIQPSTDDPPPS